MSESVATLEAEEWFPGELKPNPVPYISLVGLSAQNNAIHAVIWNSFTVSRGSDRPPLYFKLLPENYSFTTSKPKKSSYEWHIPKGILKSSWLRRHMFEMPSVCVLFVDLNWDDLYWNQKRTECVAKVEHLRRSLGTRNTRITLVLIQSSTSLPSDDSLVTERAALLCSSCDLNAKSLFVLPVSDVSQLMGYILRMETALYELSKAYYQHECKLIKGHRDQLNHTTHQLLYVRHQFKIGFFSELKQDPNTALKHYKNSYTNLMEVRVTLINLYEIKTIGAFINYKICKLCFQLNTPLDAISQFRKHIDIFKGKCEPKEIEFEHSAWLSKQYALFAGLFDAAITAGLIPSQMQNPGYYYLEAALQAVQRRKLCLSVCTQTQFNELNPQNLELFNNILQSTQQMEFFGQRPWRPGCQTLEPLDAEKERIGLKVLQYKELTTVNHSSLIITSLSNAINQFKKYKCPRMKRYLMVLVAEEYFYSKDYANALTFLDNVLPQYREEGWLPLVQNILNTALQAAYLSADAINFVKLGLEYISVTNSSKFEDKIAIQESIENIMRKQLPLVLPFVDKTDAENALKLWSNVLSVDSDSISFTMKMDSLMKFVECKPQFTSKTFECNHVMKVDLYLQSSAPKPIQLTKLNILFSDQYYNQFCEYIDTTDNESENSLLLKPLILQKFSFSINPLFKDIEQRVTIVGVNVTLGSDSMSAIMQWSFTDKINEFVPSVYKRPSIDITDIKHINTLLSTNIIKYNPNLELTVKHNPPALLNEFYLLKLWLKNREQFVASNLKLTVKVMDTNNEDTDVGFKSLIYSGNEFKELTESFPLNDIKVNDELNEEIVVKFEITGNHCIVFTVVYDSMYEMQNECKTISLSITQKAMSDVLIPFITSCELTNLSATKVAQIRRNEPFFVNVLTKENADISVEIIESMPKFDESIECLQQTNRPFKGNVFVDQTFKTVASIEYTTPVSMGMYLIKWKRKSECDSHLREPLLSETLVPLPMITVVSSPVFVDLKYPDVCVARNPMILCYHIYNRTDSNLSLELSMGTSDSFMYSGNKLIQIILEANQSAEQHYILYPLVCGSIVLPKFRIVLNPETPGAAPIDYIDQILPNDLLVIPQNKTTCDVSQTMG